MKFMILILLLITPTVLGQQYYQGPAEGELEAGITKSTDDFSFDEPIEYVMPPDEVEHPEEMVNFISLIEEDNSVNNSIDRTIEYSRSLAEIKVTEELNFDGPSFASCWVPDCNVVSGPVDVLIAINTMFWITDRDGNLIKQINTNNWFTEFIGAGLVFDPKCSYDSLSNRFIMTYLYFHRESQTSLILLCVSDDSTAEGNWNLWALPADLNGMTQENLWADFPSLTVTEDAIYYAYEMIFYNVYNQKYDKLRVIKKEGILNSTPGVISYVDYWDFRKPTNSSQSILFLRLAHNLDHSEYMYMISRDPAQFTSNYIFVYRMKNLLMAHHQIDVFNVETSYFSMPPHMKQKGGGQPMQLFGILYHEGVFRHNKIYLSHAVSSYSSQHSDIHYVEIDVDSMKMVKELFIGNPNLSYGFSDLMVDAEGNVSMVYNRSGDNEYPGAFYSVMPAEADNFTDDLSLAEGQGNMNKYCTNSSSSYIRFGDYSDISFDAVDKNNVWMMNEYIGSDNRWKTRIAKVSIDEIVNSVDNSDLVTEFYLEQNYPNPFNPSTTISYSVPQTTSVSIVIYNMLGQKVRTLVELKDYSAGTFRTTWNGRDDLGKQVASGTYIYRMQAGDFTQSKKLMIVH